MTNPIYSVHKILSKRLIMRCIFLIVFVLFLNTSNKSLALEEATIVERGAFPFRYVALTFDACPTSKGNDVDEDVLKILVKNRVPATLFMSGKWIEKNREKVIEISKEPLFEIGNHSFHHLHMAKMKASSMKKELIDTQVIIGEITGKTPKYFRPPYGEVSKSLATAADNLGLTTIQYDLASGDPNKRLSSKKLLERVLSKTKGGSIVVFHMNRNGHHTADVLLKVIVGLREKGFALVTIDELLKSEKRMLKSELYSD